jgi:hypothetical protein
MHHRRKPGRTLTTRGTVSRITTFRLPYELETAIKEEAKRRGEPWQTVLKSLLAEALGLGKPEHAEVTRVPATGLRAAVRKLGGSP